MWREREKVVENGKEVRIANRKRVSRHILHELPAGRIYEHEPGKAECACQHEIIQSRGLFCDEEYKHGEV